MYQTQLSGELVIESLKPLTPKECEKLARHGIKSLQCIKQLATQSITKQQLEWLRGISWSIPDLYQIKDVYMLADIVIMWINKTSGKVLHSILKVNKALEEVKNIGQGVIIRSIKTTEERIITIQVPKSNDGYWEGGPNMFRILHCIGVMLQWQLPSRIRKRI